MRAFHLDEESPGTREAYGRNPFGQGCLLARRLVEAGVTFVEVRSNGWDTHQKNNERVATLAQQVDPAFAALIRDLKEHGMLGRHPGRLDGRVRPDPEDQRQRRPRPFPEGLQRGPGRRRHPGRPGHRRSSADGTEVKDRPVTVPDLMASLCHALKVDATKEVQTPIGRPIKVVDGGKVVSELFG